MQKLYQFRCPKCNNSHNFYRYGKDNLGFQKYLCRNCSHQFAPDHSNSRPLRNYPRCPLCGKASFLHHDYEHYSNFRCGDKKCYHSFFVHKPSAILPPSMTTGANALLLCSTTSLLNSYLPLTSTPTNGMPTKLL